MVGERNEAESSRFDISLQLRQLLVYSYNILLTKDITSIFVVFSLLRCTCSIVWSCYFLFQYFYVFSFFFWENVQTYYVKLSIYSGLTCKSMSCIKFWCNHSNNIWYTISVYYLFLSQNFFCRFRDCLHSIVNYKLISGLMSLCSWSG